MTFIDQNPAGATHMNFVSEILSQVGGIGGLTQAFQQQGLTGILESWIGHGANLPIQSQQLVSMIGGEKFAAIAAKFGMDPKQAESILASLLPQVVDKLTPHGEVQPSHFSTGNLLSLAQSIFAKPPQP